MKNENKLFHYRAKVLRVVDGDTVDVLIDLGFDLHNKTRVRLYGINTPEVRTRDKREKARGLAAKERLKEMLRLNRNECVIRTRLDKKGKFGRLLGTLFVGEKDLNEALYAEGHAERYFC